MLERERVGLLIAESCGRATVGLGRVAEAGGSEEEEDLSVEWQQPC